MAEAGEKRDPSSHRTPGQMKRLARTYNHTPEHIHQRAERNSARAELAKEGKVHKGDGKDVDHKTSIKNGGSNSRGNLRAISASANRKKGDKNV